MRRNLWCTSALVGIGLASTAASAAEVAPGGALDVEVSGFARFLAIGGDVDNLRLDDSFSTGLDFFNDTEVHVILSGEDDASGLEYGGTVEFEADTNRTDNTDETFVFLQGAWGEVRLGDEDGVADMDGLAVSAATVAVGTDGLDSDQFEVFAGAIKTFEPVGTSDATKIRYTFQPDEEAAGLTFGISYTPNLAGLNSSSDNGDDVALIDVEVGDVVEAAVGYVDDGSGAALVLSGLYGDIKDEDATGGDDYWAGQIGAALPVLGFEIAGSYLRQEAGSIETDAITVGVAREFGPVELSIGYGQVIASDGLSVENEDTGIEDELDHPWLVVVSGTVGVLPGVTLDADVGYFDNDVKGDVQNAGGDDGWQALGRVAVGF